MQLIYTSRSTGAELLKQLRAYTDHPLTVHVREVPPPGCGNPSSPRGFCCGADRGST
jgi:hypothetical protein